MKNNKKNFELPDLELIFIDVDDVISTSNFGQRMTGDNELDYGTFWN